MSITTKTSTAGTYIDNANQSTNYGTGHLDISGSSGVEKHVLIDFGLTGTSIANLVWGQLKLYVGNCTGGDLTFNVHRVLLGWNEAQATWNSRITGTGWGTAGMLSGTDFSATVMGNGTMTAALINNWLTVDITSLAELKSMVTAGTSYGLVLRYTTTLSGTRYFQSDDDANAPQLLLYYASGVGATYLSDFGQA